MEKSEKKGRDRERGRITERNWETERERFRDWSRGREPGWDPTNPDPRPWVSTDSRLEARFPEGRLRADSVVQQSRGRETRTTHQNRRKPERSEKPVTHDPWPLNPTASSSRAEAVFRQDKSMSGGAQADFRPIEEDPSDPRAKPVGIRENCATRTLRRFDPPRPAVPVAVSGEPCPVCSSPAEARSPWPENPTREPSDPRGRPGSS